LEATLWLEGFLESQPKTLVVTSHDVAFLDAVAEETVTLRFRKLHYFEGTPSAMEVQHAKEARHVAAQQKSMDKRKQHVCRWGST
jgi:ATP-binding cassette subfamily F protein 3